MRKLHQGFSIVSAIFLLVVLAFLGVAMTTFSSTQHQSAAMDVMGSRAYQAARAGVEWAAFKVNQMTPGTQWMGCAMGTPVAVAGDLAPFTVTVNCFGMPVSEVGASPTGTIWIYDVSAVAQAGGIAGNPDYVERVISVKLGR